MAHQTIYLLTVWQEVSGHENEQQDCRYCLENPRTGERLQFTDAASLIAALLTRIDGANGQTDSNRPGG